VGRLFFFIAEALRALRRSAAPSLAAIVTVILTTLLLGVFIPVIRASSTTTENVRSQLALEVFMDVEATKKQAKSVQREINAIPHVARTEYVSKSEGLKDLRRELGNDEVSEGITQLRQNPLPILIIVRPDDPNNLDSIQAAITPPGPNGEPTPISQSIDNVSDGQGAAEDIRTVANAVKIVLLVIAVLLLVVSLMLIANTIRLSIYARRREIEVMKLVGATNWFIRWPFVLEGLIVGLVGAALAVGILWAGKLTIIDPLAENFNLIDNFSTIGFGPLVVTLMAAAIVVSALGSGVTLRRFLRV
jgi:cell division transport system permease protein